MNLNSSYIIVKNAEEFVKVQFILLYYGCCWPFKRSKIVIPSSKEFLAVIYIENQVLTHSTLSYFKQNPNYQKLTKITVEEVYEYDKS